MAKSKQPTTVYWLENKLYLNITNRCSNNCSFCLRNFKQGVDGFNLKLREEPSLEKIVRELENVLWLRNWEEVVFCGFGEPTGRLDVLLEVVRWIRKHYARTLRIRVNTNGHGLVLNQGREVATELKEAGVDKVSVSLNSENAQTYKEICKPFIEGAYNAAVEFIRRSKPFMKVEVTAVRLPEVDLGKVKDIAEGLGVDFRIREYIPCFY